jgi:galactoside O-acetyltransferase
LGDNVRIDDFCILSAGEGGISIGKFIHIAVYTSLIGKGGITIGDYSNISSRVSIYSSSDDYSGNSMTNPMIPVAFTNVSHLPVILGKHVIIGSGSIVLPGAELTDGVAIGALSVVRRNKLDPYTIYSGNPLKKINIRSKNIMFLEEKLNQLMKGD